ncbi:MAG: c-type cytochrome, partial [Candidatus Omnitrophica bacterium]|nr:c-type cytochrome [Candidatus Omnitrophota bacterium]
VGPDGAVYILDFCNPIIGHMQYSLRDERRDHAHGRIWRVSHKERPLSQQPDIDGEPIPKLLDLLNHEEIRVQKFVRRELQERDAQEVLPQLDKWLENLDPNSPKYDHSITEALWIYQGLDVPNIPLLKKVLNAEDYHARAAGGRVLRYWITMAYVDEPIPMLKELVTDPAIRVRLEGILACGFVPSSTAAGVALMAADYELDEWMEHVLKDTLEALKPYGKPKSEAGRAALAHAMTDQELLAESLDPYIAAEIVDRLTIAEEKREEALAYYAKENGMTPPRAILDLLHQADVAGREAPYLERRLLDLDTAALFAEFSTLTNLIEVANTGALRQTATAAALKGGGRRGIPDVTKLASTKDLLSAITLLDSNEPMLKNLNEMVLSELPEVHEGEDESELSLHKLAMKAAVHLPGIREKSFTRLSEIAETAPSEKYRQAAMVAMNSLPYAEWPKGFDQYAVAAKIDPQKLAFGKEVYFKEQLCATCHQPNGMGMNPAYPPLSESPWVNGDPERFIRIALNGLQGGVRVNGKDYNSAMAPLGALLTDEEAAAVLTYVRTSFGNLSTEIDKELVAKVRNETKERKKLWTAKELLGDQPTEEEMETMLPDSSGAADSDSQFVKMWTLQDFDGNLGGGSPARGKEIFVAAGCVDCHAVGGEGNKVGPELTKVSSKYRGQKLLQQILEPSAEINEEFASELVETVDEEMFTGLVLKEDSDSISILANPTNPEDLTVIAKADIVSRRPGTLSSMPTGLLIMFEREEILDLLAYLEKGGAE